MDVLVLRIGSWSYIRSKNPALQIFSLDVAGETYYLNIPLRDISVLGCDKVIDDDTIESIGQTMSVDRFKVSQVNPRVISILNPEYVTCDNFSSDSRYLESNPSNIWSLFCNMYDISGEYIVLMNYFKTRNNVSFCDHDIMVYPNNIRGIEDQQFPYAWSDYPLTYDFEVYTPHNDFVDANRKEDEITSVSGVFNYRGKNNAPVAEAFIYVNNWKGFDSSMIRKEELFTKNQIPHIVKEFANEKDMLKFYISEIVSKKPRYIVDYNGKSFDMPYFLKRCELHNLSLNNLSMIRDLQAHASFEYVKTPFGGEYLNVVNLPGVPHVDLLYYYREYIPTLPNHQLETVSAAVLGKGKTGMTIPAFYKALETKDKTLLRDAAEYSLRDSVALQEHWVDAGVGKRIAVFAATSSVHPDKLFLTYNNYIVDKILRRVDPGYIVPNCSHECVIVPSKKPSKGVYLDTYTYSYGMLLLRIMHHYEMGIYWYLMNAPVELIEMIFFLPQVSNIDAVEEFKRIMIEIDDAVIKYGKGIIITNQELDSTFYNLTDISSVTYFPTQSSYLELETGTGVLRRHGQGLLIKHEFPFVEKYMTNFMTYIKETETIEIQEYEDVLTAHVKDLVYSKWVEKSSNYDPNSRNKLSRQKKIVALLAEEKYGKTDVNPMTKMMLSWVIAKSGPVLCDEDGKSEDGKEILPDYIYYEGEMRKIATKIEASFD